MTRFSAAPAAVTVLANDRSSLEARQIVFINGQWREAASNTHFTSSNPATGEAIDQIPAGGAEDAVAAIDAAHAAFPAWSGRSAYERSAILYKAYTLMVERKDELAMLMTT